MWNGESQKDQVSDDQEAMKLHLQELDKELNTIRIWTG